MSEYIGGPRDGEEIDLVDGNIPDEAWVIEGRFTHHYVLDSFGRLVHRGYTDDQ